MKKVGKTIRQFRYDLNQINYDYTVEVRNRFKRLDLVDRLPGELWAEACKKTKWLSEEDLQKQKGREAKGKGEKGRIHPTERRVSENSEERYESLLKLKMQRNRGKQWNEKH